MPDPMVGLGLDIGGTKTRGVLGDPHYRILADVTALTLPGEEGVRATVTTVTAGLFAQTGMTTADLASVGVGVPGIVDAATGTVTSAVNLDIRTSALGEVLRNDLGAPVRIENDVNAAALGAQWTLRPRVDELCYLNVGTGLAAGVISGGTLVRGARGGAGELGHFALDPVGEECPCGQRGCLETVLGGAAIARRLASLGVQLADLPAAEGPGPRAERRRITHTLATAILLVLAAYEPEIVMLDGGVVANAPWLLREVSEELRRRARQSAFVSSLSPDERLARPAAGIPIGALGAAVVGRTAL